MDLLASLTTGLLALYTLQVGIVLYGQFRRSRAFSATPVRDEELPFISVLIAVRNEEKNLPRLLDTLLAQDYPAERHEIIVVNDHSEDRTPQILEDYKGRFRNMVVVHAAERPTDLTGKEHAIEQAKKVAQGELYLFTDGDCTVRPSWITAYAQEYRRGNAFIFSRTDVRASSLSSLVQRVDLDIMFAVAGGLAKTGKPASCMGTNFAVSRALDERLGSYRDRGASAVEDYIILTAARLRDVPIAYIDSVPPLVTTLPQASFVAFLSQGLRWMSGGSVFKSRFLLLWLLPMTLLHFALGALLFAGVLSSISSFTLFLWTAAIDLLFHIGVAVKFRSPMNLLVFPLFELFYILRTIVYPLLLPFVEKRLRWKGRALDFLDASRPA